MDPSKPQKVWVNWLISHEPQVREKKAYLFNRGLRYSIMMKEMAIFSFRFGKYLGRVIQAAIGTLLQILEALRRRNACIYISILKDT